MVNLTEIKNNIVKVTLGSNLFFLIISIFVQSKAFVITAIAINIIFNGTLLMMAKFGDIFETRRGPLGNILGTLGTQLDSLVGKEENDGQIQQEV